MHWHLHRLWARIAAVACTQTIEHVFHVGLPVVPIRNGLWAHAIGQCCGLNSRRLYIFVALEGIVDESRLLEWGLAVRAEALARRPLVPIKCPHLFDAPLVEYVLRGAERAAKGDDGLAELELTHADAALLLFFEPKGLPTSGLGQLNLSRVDDVRLRLAPLHHHIVVAPFPVPVFAALA